MIAIAVSASVRTLRSLTIRACRGADVVLFMGMVLDPPMIVSEWCSRGSVHDILSKAAHNPRLAAQLTWHRRLCMALDAAKVSSERAHLSWLHVCLARGSLSLPQCQQHSMWC